MMEILIQVMGVLPPAKLNLDSTVIYISHMFALLVSIPLNVVNVLEHYRKNV